MARLAATYLNERIELLDGLYEPDRQAEIDAVSRLYNRLIGPVTSLILFRPEILDLPFYSSSCHHSSVGSLVSDLRIKTGVADAVVFPGGGKGRRMASSALGGLGEVAERLLGALHSQTMVDQVLYGSYVDLMRRGYAPLSPEQLPLFSAEQYASPRFPYAPFGPDTVLGWIEGRDLLSDEPVLVPAQLVLVYYGLRRSEARIGYPTSGGLAFHSDQRRAVLHGLYEVVERDAINVRWYCRLPPPSVDVDLADMLARDLHLRPGRLSTPSIDRVRIYLNTLDVPIPVFSAVAIDRARRDQALMMGGGASSRREQALEQALFELGQCRTALKFEKTLHAKTVAPDTTVLDMDDFFDALVYYGHAENLPRLSWFTGTPASVAWAAVPSFEFDSPEEEFAAALRWLEPLGLRPIVLDLSAACWQGAAVTKVFVPGLTQASVPSHPFLGHPRFYQLPLHLGLAERLLRFADLNTDPPPFP